MATHYLKTHDAYFDAVKEGAKTFEVRRDDRGFQRGDTVILQRYGATRFGPKYKSHAHCLGVWQNEAETLGFSIGWILTGGQFGIEPGFVVFSLQALRTQKEPNDE